MEVYQEEPPPNYSQVSENHAITASAALVTAPHAVMTQTGAIKPTGYCEGRRNVANRCAVGSTDGQNTTDYHTMGTCNASHSFSGFIDILYKNEKLPWGCEKNLIYKVGLLVYFFANFVYSIVAAALQKEHLAFYLIYIFISLIGSASGIGVLIMHIKKLCILDDNTEEETGLLNSTNAHIARVRKYSHKAKRVAIDYVLMSLGELLIYPILICTLYGFINERAWRFENKISKCNFAFLLYSVVMQFLYMNVYVILLVARVARATYAKYDDLIQFTEMEWKRYFTPVYLTIPLAVLTALTHWFMIGIIGVRIYIDNFPPEKDNTNSSIPNTGDYKLPTFTGYMIVCTVYLPIVSWITFILLNKLWFYEVLSAIYQMTNGAICMPPQPVWNKKIFAFLKDPLAYIAIVFLMLPFVAFTAGTYLVDYNIEDYEVASSARNTIQGIAPYFIIFFVLSNFQAVIIFVAVLVALVAVTLCGLPALCCKKRSI